MLFSTLSVFAAFFAATLAAPACTAEKRLYYSNQVPVAYSQNSTGATYEAFHNIPFGVPNLEGACTTTIYPNGGSGVTVGTTGNGVVNFGVESRQVFSSVTGKYVDFPHNGTTVIYTNVTLGARSDAVIPVTFSGQVYLDFNVLCRISAVRAYAEVPTYINGQPTDLYKFLPVPQTPQIT